MLRSSEIKPLFVDLSLCDKSFFFLLRWFWPHMDSSSSFLYWGKVYRIWFVLIFSQCWPHMIFLNISLYSSHMNCFYIFTMLIAYDFFPSYTEVRFIAYDLSSYFHYVDRIWFVLTFLYINRIWIVLTFSPCWSHMISLYISTMLTAYEFKEC